MHGQVREEDMRSWGQEGSKALSDSASSSSFSSFCSLEAILPPTKPHCWLTPMGGKRRKREEEEEEEEEKSSPNWIQPAFVRSGGFSCWEGRERKKRRVSWNGRKSTSRRSDWISLYSVQLNGTSLATFTLVVSPSCKDSSGLISEVWKVLLFLSLFRFLVLCAPDHWWIGAVSDTAGEAVLCNSHQKCPFLQFPALFPFPICPSVYSRYHYVLQPCKLVTYDIRT